MLFATPRSQLQTPRARHLTRANVHSLQSQLGNCLAQMLLQLFHLHEESLNLTASILDHEETTNQPTGLNQPTHQGQGCGEDV